MTLAHGPFKTLGMPGMTMTFPLADPALMVGIKTGDKVRVAVRQTDDGLLVERLEKLGGQP
ncbi:Copper binding periplasmic protein CusF [compost metagenome]